MIAVAQAKAQAAENTEMTINQALLIRSWSFQSSYAMTCMQVILCLMEKTGLSISSLESELLSSRDASRNTQALAAVHDHYYPVIYRYLSYRLEDQSLAEDIASEVFLRLLDALEKRPASIRDLKAWLLGTAANLVHDHLRLKYRRPEEPLDKREEISTGTGIEGTVEQSIERRRIRQTLQKLTLEQQHVLALRFSQELSIEETARIMGKSINAIKVLQFRALASIRRLLEEK